MPQVDYEKLRELGGYKTVVSAAACYSPVKNKFLGKTSAKMTARDREILVMAWKCFKSVPQVKSLCQNYLSERRLTFSTYQVDYKKLQEAAGYKTTASAAACYGSIKNKLLGTKGEIKGGSKRKAAADSGDEEASPAPKKRVKKVASKSKGEGTKSDYVTTKADDSPDHRVGVSTLLGRDAVESSPIKDEPQDDFVDGSLLAGAVQLLNDQEADDDVLS